MTDHLLAAAVDHLATANWMFMCVNTDEDGEQPDPPQPVPRPSAPDDDEDAPEDGESSAGPDEDGPTSLSPWEVARFFG
ncbi:hypothetical protein [Streptomyces sp. NPDC090025]|uniref:hypothetical protein n=1 Tax=Streptomyces sp. NPDC090025 TaxID=3365922 RepID=UPI0038397E92